MFLLSLSRIIKFSLQNFGRNIWLSVVTITIITLTLFSVTTLVFVNAITGEAVKIVKAKVDVSVYFKPAVAPEQVLAVQDALRTLPYVKGVRYVAKADALEKLRAQFNDSQLIMEALKELDDNPLGDTLIVSARTAPDYQKIIDLLNVSPQYAALIDSKSFDDNRFIIDKLEKLSGQIKAGVWGVTIFFAAIAVLVIVNTIRIAVYTHRDEVAIMKLVGASNPFVRGPFLGEAVIYACLGTIFTIGLAYLVAAGADPYAAGLLGQSDFSLLAYLNRNFFAIFITEFVGMMVFSVAATAAALSRYLKV